MHLRKAEPITDSWARQPRQSIPAQRNGQAKARSNPTPQACLRAQPAHFPSLPWRHPSPSYSSSLHTGPAIRHAPAYNPPWRPTAISQNPVWLLLVLLGAPSHATCLYLSHLPALPRPHGSLYTPCCFPSASSCKLFLSLQASEGLTCLHSGNRPP